MLHISDQVHPGHVDQTILQEVQRAPGGRLDPVHPGTGPSRTGTVGQRREQWSAAGDEHIGPSYLRGLDERHLDVGGLCRYVRHPVAGPRIGRVKGVSHPAFTDSPNRHSPARGRALVR